MSKCSFAIPFSGSAMEMLNKAQTAVEQQGGRFSGDAAGGHFSLQVFGTIAGRYTVAGQELHIVIEEKPMMIPCGVIESALKKQIGSVEGPA
jgi:hypothetical protein